MQNEYELEQIIADAEPYQTIWLKPGVYCGNVDIRKPLHIEAVPGSVLWDGRFEDTFRVQSDEVALVGLWLTNGRDHGFGAQHCRALCIEDCIAWQDVPPVADRERMKNTHVFGLDQCEDVSLHRVGAFGWGRKTIEFHYCRGVQGEHLYARWDGRYPYGENEGNRGAFAPQYGSGNVRIRNVYLTHGGTADTRLVPADYDPGCNLLLADAPDDWVQPVELSDVTCVVNPDAPLSCSRPIRLTTSPNFRLGARVHGGELVGPCRFYTDDRGGVHSTASVRTRGGIQQDETWTVFHEDYGSTFVPNVDMILPREFAEQLLAASRRSVWAEIH